MPRTFSPRHFPVDQLYSSQVFEGKCESNGGPESYYPKPFGFEVCSYSFDDYLACFIPAIRKYFLPHSSPPALLSRDALRISCSRRRTAIGRRHAQPHGSCWPTGGGVGLTSRDRRF